MRNIKLVIEYDGTNYLGFQRLPKGRTIQGELEEKLSKVMKEPIKVIGAGRTDAGVHALGQVINFKTQCQIPIDNVCIALNRLLPKDIVAKKAEEVPAEFHARYQAKSKVYRYTILNQKKPSALLARFAYHLPQPLDLEAMRSASFCLVGTHDFRSFSIAGTRSRDYIRSLYSLRCTRKGKFIYITLEASGFLRGMARKIVSTLIKVGLDKIAPEEVASILESKDRWRAGPPAPPQGLCLIKVRY